MQRTKKFGAKTNRKTLYDSKFCKIIIKQKTSISRLASCLSIGHQFFAFHLHSTPMCCRCVGTVQHTDLPGWKKCDCASFQLEVEQHRRRVRALARTQGLLCRSGNCDVIRTAVLAVCICPHRCHNAIELTLVRVWFTMLSETACAGKQSTLLSIICSIH